MKACQVPSLVDRATDVFQIVFHTLKVKNDFGKYRIEAHVSKS